MMKLKPGLVFSMAPSQSFFVHAPIFTLQSRIGISLSPDSPIFLCFHSGSIFFFAFLFNSFTQSQVYGNPLTIAMTITQCSKSGRLYCIVLCWYCTRQMTNSAYNTLTVASQIPWHVVEGVRWNLSVSWIDKKLGKATPAFSNSMWGFPAEKSVYPQVHHTESARVDAVSVLPGLVIK